MITKRHTGGCLCGAVRFAATGKLRGIVYCHCTQCRRQSGHYFASTNVQNDGLSVEGAENLRWFKSSDEAERGFCSHCGSVMFWRIAGRDYTSINAGAFDTPTSLKAEMHIFVADKGDYYTIDDGLPQFERSSASVKVAGG
ncbi:MAG: GFA family protein [Phyllobacteriaceae bacterium]|nr:GFA family protein [Phyllobacteriaceae bacterium]